MENKTNRVFSKVLINPKFQFSVIGFFTGITLVGSAILYGVVYFVFSEFMKHGQQIGLEKGDIYFQFISWQKDKFDLAFLGVGAFIFIGFVLGGLFLSHKIAGPMYRFNKYLTEEKNNENIKELKFREGDYFSELAEHFNEYQASKYIPILKDDEVKKVG